MGTEETLNTEQTIKEYDAKPTWWTKRGKMQSSCKFMVSLYLSRLTLTSNLIHLKMYQRKADIHVWNWDYSESWLE